jgi:twitching motility two-component system response regulator PilG
MNNGVDVNAQTQIALHQGVLAAQAREFDRARELLQHVITETPDNVLAWYWLATAAQSADAAINCLRRVLIIDNAHAPAREALARLLVAEARTTAASGNRDAARTLATEASGLQPDAVYTWKTLADLAASHVDRIEALRRIFALAPDDTGVRTQLRQALLARAVMIANSDRNEARSRFREAAALSPSDPRIWQALCNLASSREEQLQSLRELLRIAPEHPQGRSLFRKTLIDDARALTAAADNETACSRWHEVIDLTGGDVEAWLGLAETTTDASEAEHAIELAYQLDPQDARAKAAIEKIRGPQIDPSSLPAADAAFARFDAGVAPAAEVHGSEVDDSMFNALAQLPVTDAPPAAEAAPAAATASPTTPAPAAANGSATATVLVVDDSPTIRKILGLTLERAGYRVVAESNGQAALDRLKDLVPRVVLLDIAMPDLDGYEVCKRIKQDPRTSAVPVIMLSGKGAFFDKVKGHMAGATEYLTKPFETPEVLAVVTAHCQAEAHHG